MLLLAVVLDERGTMALAHTGYGPADNTRLRILLALFEAGTSGARPNYHEIRLRAGIGYGTLIHHLPGLTSAGYIDRGGQRRQLRVTQHGVALLLEHDLIEQVALIPSYAVSARGVELLELPRKHVLSAAHGPEGNGR